MISEHKIPNSAFIYFHHFVSYLESLYSILDIELM